MKGDWTHSEITAAHHVLEGLGFVMTFASNDPDNYIQEPGKYPEDAFRREIFTHPQDYEVRIEFSNKYPFQIRYPGQQEYELDFSFDGLIDQLYNIDFKEEKS